jgi:uncharacterized protein (DUF2164 family)
MPNDFKDSTMDKIEFTRQEKELMAQKVKVYFRDELNQDIGGFDAEFLVDFFAREMGGFFYNRGLYDAETLITEKVSEISDQLLELEKPVSLS